MKYLERELQGVMFERGGRSATLTQAGRALLERAQRSLVEIEIARAELREFSKLERGQVNVGLMSPSGGMRWAPRLLAAFKRRYPLIDVTLIERPNDKLLALLQDGVLHGAWLVTPANVLSGGVPGLRAAAFFTGELVFGVATSHPLADRGTVTVGQLAQESLIVPQPAEPVRAIVDRAFAAKNVTPVVGFEISDPAIRLELAAEGLGIAVASEPHIRQVPGDRLRVLEPADLAMPYSWSLVWAERGPRTRALDAFIEFTTAQVWVREGVIRPRSAQSATLPA
jgi:DNA-binding transcriptional LysR family regulator